MNLVRRLTYRPEVKALVRALHVRRMAKECYWRWARPVDGILRLQMGSHEARFYVRTLGELRNLDPAGSAQGEKHLLELLITVLRPGDVVYDVGSNIGLYAVFCAKAVGEQGQVIAFEPDSESYAHLQENLKLNGLANVISFRKALGEQSGQGKLYRGEENADSSLVSPSTGRDLGHELVEVEEGDGFIKAMNLPLPRAVKIDVEGYEYAVIRGLRHILAQQSCELLVCEIHPRLLSQGVGPDGLLELISSLGFSRIDSHPRYDTFHLVAYKARFQSSN